MRKIHQRYLLDSPLSKVYLHGGFIRDQIQNRYSSDWDLMISEEICEEFIEDFIFELENLDCEIFVMRSFFILKEYPKEDEKYYQLLLENNLKIGIVELK